MVSLFRIIKFSPYIIFANMLGICGLLNMRLAFVPEMKSNKNRIIKVIVGGFDGSIWTRFDF